MVPHYGLNGRKWVIAWASSAVAWRTRGPWRLLGGQDQETSAIQMKKYLTATERSLLSMHVALAVLCHRQILWDGQHFLNVASGWQITSLSLDLYRMSCFIAYLLLIRSISRNRLINVECHTISTMNTYSRKKKLVSRPSIIKLDQCILSLEVVLQKGLKHA